MPPAKPVPALATDAAQIAHARAQQLADDFEAVFGQPERRTESQQRVYAHLSECASDAGNSYDFLGAKDGITLVAAGIHRDGARSVLRVIDRKLNLALASREKPKAKPVVKR